MAKKSLSVGVKAALIGAFALVLAAVIPLLHHQPQLPSQSVNNSAGVIQAGRDVIIQHGDDRATDSSEFDLARKYDEKFENMTKKRVKAAIAIQEYFSKRDWRFVTNSTDALDDILGFFDILGYNEQNHLITADVIDEYFGDDITAYYAASAEYIAKIQKADGKTTFVNIHPLAESVLEIEARKQHTNIAAIRWDEEDLIKYFQSETNAVNLKES